MFPYEGVDYEYPPNYGLAVCSSWDADLDPFCTENGPDFCGAEWCFVSPDCEASDTTTANLNAEIAYSYATCGFSADFPDEGEEAETVDEPEVDEGEEEAPTRFEMLIEAIKESAAEEGAGVEEPVTEEEVDEPVAEEEDEAPTVEEETDQPVVEEENTEEPAQNDEQVDETGICECLITHGQAVTFPEDGEPFITYTIDGVDFEYPPNYGSGVCAAWDSGLEPDCADDSEDFCAAMWCYVSPDCEASDVTVSNLNAEISYSYATCGDMVEAAVEDEESVAGEGEEVAQEEDEEVPFPEELGVCECLMSHGQDVYFPLVGEAYILAPFGVSELEYPWDYGTASCGPWDMDLEPSCAMNEEDYCELAWCYVAEDCMASDVTESGLFEGLQYSYRTCGYNADS